MESSLSGVSGRLFRIDSISTKNVCRDSSSKLRSLQLNKNLFYNFKICFTTLTKISQASPLVGANGGLKSHSTPFCRRDSWRVCWFHCFTPRSSRSAERKFKPQSLYILRTVPLRWTNLTNACRNELAVIECATSTCTARDAMQVNKQPYLFTWLLPTFANWGTK